MWAYERADSNAGVSSGGLGLHGQIEDEGDRICCGVWSKSKLENETARRQSAISHFEGFRKKYPSAEYTPHVLYRLAELYFEDSEEAFLDELDEYNRLEILAQEDFEMEPPEPPTKDYARSIELYEEIVDRFPSYKFVDGALLLVLLLEDNSTSMTIQSDGSTVNWFRIFRQQGNGGRRLAIGRALL